MEKRESRRDRDWRHGARVRREHRRVAHPRGDVDCVCEWSVWYFRKRNVVWCDCHRRAPGSPKFGRGCCAVGYRPAVRERIEGARLCRGWAAWKGAPDDCEL